MTEGIGKTAYEPIAVKINYRRVDLVNKQVEASIEYQGAAIMNVVVDVAEGTTKKEGNLERIAGLAPTMREADYLKMIQYWATFFVENGICDANKYFEQRP